MALPNARYLDRMLGQRILPERLAAGGDGSEAADVLAGVAVQPSSAGDLVHRFICSTCDLRSPSQKAGDSILADRPYSRLEMKAGDSQLH